MGLVAAIFDRKKDDLPREIVESVPNINEDPRIAAAHELLEKLRREKNETIGTLSKTNDPDVHARPTSDIAASAKLLLGGSPLETLTDGPAGGTNRATLVRRLSALSMAIPQAESRQQETIQRVLLEACEQVRPLAEQVEIDVLDAFGHLVKVLRQKAAFYELITRRGFSLPGRPGHWNLMPIEEVLLFGGSNFPSLEFFMAERRKYWKLDGKDGK